jgi:hypothetical protein
MDWHFCTRPAGKSQTDFLVDYRIFSAEEAIILQVVNLS